MADCCCLLSLGDLGTMAGGLAERECTSLRKGLAGEGARFSLFFSNWWFCGLVSLPEPLGLSIIHRHRQQGGDEGNDQSTTPRKISDMRHQKNSQLSSLPSSSSGWGCASCVGLRCFTPSRLHSPGCHCSPLWRKHRNKKRGDYWDGWDDRQVASADRARKAQVKKQRVSPPLPPRIGSPSLCYTGL